MSVTAKSLWYIETRLDQDLNLETVAAALDVSRFHLSRAFSVSTGYSFSGYIRARRLSEAAKALTNGAPDILTLALAAGYNSHEAFTRAFSAYFGITPEQYRAQEGAIRPLQEPLRMNPSTPMPLAPPRLVESPELLLFGLGQRVYKGGDAAIPALWSRFGPYIGNIPGQVGHTTYGVIIDPDDKPGFEYICAVEVRAFPTEPAEFARLRLTPTTYAVFEHRDHVSTIFATMQAIWNHGLSEAKLQPAAAPAFERYGESFDAKTGLGGFEIWVPIRT